MAASKAKHSNLKKIPGHPGVYTFVQITRDPRAEKTLLDKIARDAARLSAKRFQALDSIGIRG